MDITLTTSEFVAPTTSVSDQITTALERDAPTTWSDITIPSGTSESNLDLTAAEYPCRVLPASGEASNWTGATFGVRGFNNRYNITATITATSISGIWFLPSGQIVVHGAGVQITGTTPAETTEDHGGTAYAIHGAMKNPTVTVNPFSQTQGLDERSYPNINDTYDASVAASYPVSMSAGDTFIKAQSRVGGVRAIDVDAASLNDSNLRLGLFTGFLEIMVVDTAPSDTAFGFTVLRGGGVGTAPGIPNPTIYNIDFGTTHSAVRSTSLGKVSLTDAGYSDVRSTNEIMEALPNSLTLRAINYGNVLAQLHISTGYLDGEPISAYGGVMVGRVVMALQRICSSDTSVHDSLRLYRRLLNMAMSEYEYGKAVYDEHVRAPTTSSGQRLYPRLGLNGVGGHEGRFIALPPLWLHATNRKSELADVVNTCGGNLNVYFRIPQSTLDQFDVPHDDPDKLNTSRRREVLSASNAAGTVRVESFPGDDFGSLNFTGYDLINTTVSASAKVLATPDPFSSTLNGTGMQVEVDEADVEAAFPVGHTVYFSPRQQPALNEPDYYQNPDDKFYSISPKAAYRSLQNWGGQLLYLWSMGLLEETEGQVGFNDAYLRATEYMINSHYANSPSIDRDYQNMVGHEQGNWAKEVYEDFYGTMIPFAEPLAIDISPAPGAKNQPPATTPSIRYSEPVSFGTGTIEIYNVTDATSVETMDVTTNVGTAGGQVNISDRTLTVYPTSNFTLGKQYEIRIPATCIEDPDGNTAAAIATGGWQFTVENSIYAVTNREKNAYDLSLAYPDDLNAYTLVVGFRKVGTGTTDLVTVAGDTLLQADSGAIRFWNRSGGSGNQTFVSVTGGISDGDLVALMVSVTRDSGTGDWTTTILGRNVTTSTDISGSESGNWAQAFTKPGQIGRSAVNENNPFDLIAVSFFADHLAPATYFTSFFDSADSYRPTTDLLWGADVNSLTPVFARSGNAPTWNGDPQIVGQFGDGTAPAVWT